jgi:hypothetical protein
MNLTLSPLVGYEPPPSDALRDHARSLYDRRHEAVVVPYVDVASADWRPSEKLCHENCVEWCERNPDHRLVRGWLYVPLQGLAYCRFVSYSVVRRPDDTLMDITPRGSLRESKPYPFVASGVSDDDYAALAAELYAVSGNGNLDWQHGQAGANG